MFNIGQFHLTLICYLQIQSEVAGENKSQGPVKLIFPVMAFLAGSLGGVFGVGGGMLISPLLLQVGITPQVSTNQHITLITE